MKIQTTSVEQTANELLGTESKKLYYLVIENKKGTRLTINVGQKTHDSIKKLNEEEQKFIETTNALKEKHANETKLK